MRPLCPRCGGDHRGWEIGLCNKTLAAKQTVKTPAPVVAPKKKAAQKKASAKPPPIEVGKTFAEQRKAYRREWMKKKRAGEKK